MEEKIKKNKVTVNKWGEEFEIQLNEGEKYEENSFEKILSLDDFETFLKERQNDL